MSRFIQRVFQTLLGFGLFCLVFFFFKNSIFSLAIQYNFLKLAEAALDCGVESKSWDAATTSKMSWHLTQSAKKGHLKIVRLLLEAGLSANSHAPSDDPPLIWAAQHGHSEIVTLLLENGADVNYQTEENGLTPLMMAAWKKHGDIYEMLLNAGADPTLRCRWGWTAKDFL
ncbi:MAG: ankyrin repeat domain-containing protein [Akkermansia sp.]|nr:ankyrin repeat domain-containing protein [Akkermansia sp.]